MTLGPSARRVNGPHDAVPAVERLRNKDFQPLPVVCSDREPVKFKVHYRVVRHDRNRATFGLDWWSLRMEVQHDRDVFPWVARRMNFKPFVSFCKGVQVSHGHGPLDRAGLEEADSHWQGLFKQMENLPLLFVADLHDLGTAIRHTAFDIFFLNRTLGAKFLEVPLGLRVIGPNVRGFSMAEAVSKRCLVNQLDVCLHHC